MQRFESSRQWDELEEYEEWDPSKGSFIVHAVAGSVAGASEHCLMYPFDTIKTYAQAEGLGDSPSYLRRIVHREGLRRLWRGISVMLSASIPAHAAYFSIYEFSKESLGANVDELAPIAAGASGVLATLAHDAIMTPMDVVKQRLQLGFHSGVMDCMRAIVRTEGASALFISYPTTLLMNVPYAGITVAANESFKKILNPSNEYNLAAFLASGAAAGALASACTTPLDVVKTRLQTQSIIKSLNTNSATTVTGGSSTKGPGSSASSSATSEGFLGLKRKHHTNNFGGLRTGLGLRYHYSMHSKEQYLKQGKRYSLRFNNGLGMGPSVGNFVVDVDKPKAQSSVNPNFNPNGKVKMSTSSSSSSQGIQYRGLVDAVRIIYRQEGTRGFLRGLKPRLMVHTPSVAISWTAYETAKEFLIQF